MAEAQIPTCAPREVVLALLAQTYAEETVAIGITAKGALLEILASPKGTWTVIVTLPGGPSCVMAAGDGWRMFQEAPDGPLA